MSADHAFTGTTANITAGGIKDSGVSAKGGNAVRDCMIGI